MHELFMKKAIELSIENVKTGKGGPFGAVIVKNNEIIATGVNQVTASNDPTAHAEIVAIRAACKALGTFQLTDCILYSSCEPCPMCLSAIYWARPMAVYYANSARDAAAINFDDAFIYEQIATPYEQRTILCTRITHDQALVAFELWQLSQDKIGY
jgi:tRNA(Arg) A34 adenosine deaminase TadA